MSRSESLPSLVLEWSPTGVSLYDPVTRRTQTGQSVAEVAVGKSGKEVLIAVSRRASFIRILRVPDAPKDEVRQALALTVGQHLPVPPGDSCFDLRLGHDVNSEGRLAVVCAMRSSELKQLLSEVAAAGLRPRAVVPAALGAQLVAEASGQRDCAVVSPTTDGLAIDLIADGELRYSRVLAPGATLLGVDMEVSRTYAAASLPCAPTLAAGGAHVEEPEFRTDLHPLELLAKTSRDRIGIHLELPETIARRAAAGRANRARFAAAVAIAAVVVATLVYLDRADKQAEVQRQRALIQNSIRGMRNKQSAIGAKLSATDEIRNRLDRAFRPTQRLSDVATVASNLTPDGVWLTSVSVDRGKVLVLRGTARSNEAAALYLQRLSTEARFRDVRMLFANNAQIEKIPVVQFSIQAFPVGNLPLTDEKERRR